MMAYGRELLVWLPDIGSGLGETDVGEDAIDELAGHFSRIDRVIVEGGDNREDDRPRVGSQGHVAEMNFVERSFADAEKKRAALLERDIGGAGDQRVGQAMRDRG